MPDNITMGMSSNMAEISNAANCVWATLDINSPNDSAKRM